MWSLDGALLISREHDGVITPISIDIGGYDLDLGGNEMKMRAPSFLQSLPSRKRLVLLICLITSVHIAMTDVANAQSHEVEDFYKSKSINFIVGFNTGGSADAYARLIGRHISRHIPGSPKVTIRNMQGAGSLNAANYIYNVSQRDGSEIGLFAGHLAIDPAISEGAFKYDAQKFGWIGSPAAAVNVCISRKESTFTSLHDVIKNEMIIGTTGAAGNSTYDMPTILNNIVGSKFKLVKGYAGSAALNIAMIRGEIEGFCGVGLDYLRGAGLAEGNANILVQVGLVKSAQLPLAPFIMDHPMNEDDRQIMRFVFGWLNFERVIVTPPGVPQARFEALREGFEATMRDPLFLEDAQRAQLNIEAMRGSDISKFLVESYQTPLAIRHKAKKYLGR
jgi:tripartite-type tricarboxylate transporter receptor subunit TctC